MPAPPEIEQQPTTRPKTLFEAILGHPPLDLCKSPPHDLRTQPPSLNLCRRKLPSCRHMRAARRKILLP